MASATRPAHLSSTPTPGVQLYQGRHPEQTLLYRTVAEHFETWLELVRSWPTDELHVAKLLVVKRPVVSGSYWHIVD